MGAREEHAGLRRPGRIVLCAALAGACLTACAITAPAPGGALRSGAFRQIQPTWAVGYGPARATVTRNGMGQTPIQVSGNAQNVGGYSSMALLGSPIPISVGVRQSVGSAVDLAATLGMMDSGIELRAGSPDEDARQPWLISASARTGRVSLIGTDTYEGRLKVEAYPRIDEDESRSVRLVLSAGLSGGVFPHVLALPYDRPDSEVSAPPTVDILRPELRIETALGIHRRTSGGSLTVAVAPWFVVANGTPHARPGSDWTVGAFSQGAGVSLLLSISPSALTR